MTRMALLLFALCASPWAAQAQDPTFVVTAASADVHRSPSLGSPVIGRAARGDALAVARDVGDWVKVAWPDDPAGAGYVRLTLGRRAMPPAAPAAQAAAAPAAAAGMALQRTAPAEPAANLPDPAAREFEGHGVLPAYVARPSHAAGVGALMHGPSLGFGASARAWSRDRIGLQLQVARHTRDAPFDARQITSTQIAPSLLVSVANVFTDYVWFRPYVGAGLSVYRSSLTTPVAGASASNSRLGAQFFGGAELTFAAASQIGLSLDYGYRRIEPPFAGFDLDPMMLGISAHWYLK